MDKRWITILVVLAVGYFLGVFMPGPGAQLKTKLGL